MDKNLENSFTPFSPSGFNLNQENIPQSISTNLGDLNAMLFLGEDIKKPSQEENLLSKKEKQRLYDKKSYSKKSGLSQLSVYEQAKNFLKKNENSIEKLQSDILWSQLQKDDRKKIKNFLRHARHQKKCQVSTNLVPPKSSQQMSSLSEEQKNIIEHIQVNRNETISKELCAAQNHEQQMAVLLQHNNHNHLAIFDFLKSLQQEPFDGFSNVLLDVIEQLDDSMEQVRLLVGLCGLYNGQVLKPSIDLSSPLLTYFSCQDGVTTQQALGFLKFSFVTKGDIHQTQLSDLQEFDRRHKQCFVGFKQWLQWTFKIPADLALVLPHSCHVLGLPFAKTLQKDSKLLTEHIPSQFLQIFIQILVFTFEKDKGHFEKALAAIKNGFRTLIEKVENTQLLNLFKYLLEEIRAYSHYWYRNLKDTSALIEGAFEMVKENKIQHFDTTTCRKLLTKAESPDQYLSAPSFLKKHTNYENENKLRAFHQLNQSNKQLSSFLGDFDGSKPLSEKLGQIFKSLQIIPHFLQALCSKFMLENNITTHYFINLGPGLGKTKLILSRAIYLAQTSKDVLIILNTNETLLERDYAQALPVLNQLNISTDLTLSKGTRIVFLTLEKLLTAEISTSFSVLLDEYQNVFFSKDKVFEAIKILAKATSFVGFSGSPTTFMQQTFLEACFKQSIVVYFTESGSFDKQQTLVCENQTKHFNELVKAGKQFYQEVPVVFIVNKVIAAALVSKNKRLPFVNLLKQAPTEVNSSLQTFFNKPREDGTYGLYLIDETMGTGTDFLTSTQIEANGGLVLIFAIQPTSSGVFEQLNCRVGRIFNKARRFYIIHDNSYKGSGSAYLQHKLSVIKAQEDKDIKMLFNLLKAFLNKEDDSNAVNEGGNDDIQILGVPFGNLEANSNATNTQVNLSSNAKVTDDDLNIEPELSNDDDDVKMIDAQQLNNELVKLQQKQQEQDECKTCTDKCTCVVQKQTNKKVHSNEKKMMTTNQNRVFVKKDFKASTTLGKHKAGTQINDLQKDLAVNLNKKQIISSKVAPVQAIIDKAYYGNYGREDIHEQMLEDQVRMNAYANAIEQQCKDKIVLDVGSGSGVLSGYAMLTKAKEVYGVDKADVKQIMRKQLKKMKVNLKEHQFEFINDRIESNIAQEKIPKVDVVVSEWMGYFLLFENMVGSYVFAVKNFLKPDGIMIPSEANMFINAVAYEKRILPKYKDDGLVMIDCCKTDYLISDPMNIKKIDFMDRANLVNPLDDGGFTSNFEIKITKAGMFNAFAGYFDTKLADNVLLSTSHNDPQTHWKQSMFFISNPIEVSEGEIIEGTIKVGVDPDNYRNLIVKFSYKVEGKGGSQADESFTFE